MHYEYTPTVRKKNFGKQLFFRTANFLVKTFIHFVLVLKSQLYYRRFPQFNVLFLHRCRDLAGYVITDQLTNGGGEVKIHRVNILCHKTVLQCPVHSLPYQFRFFCKVQMIKQHSSRQDRTEWISDVFPCSLRIRTMYGFKQCIAFANRSRGEKAQRSSDHASLIADDVTKHIFGQYDIELFGIENNLHCCIIYKQEINFYIGVLWSNGLYYFPPKPGSFQYVCFINQCQFISSFLRSLESQVCNAFNFFA